MPSLGVRSPWAGTFCQNLGRYAGRDRKFGLSSEFFFSTITYINSNSTGDFVPEFLLLPLSQDKGTQGQENFFVTGDKGTTRHPVSVCPRTFRKNGNANLNYGGFDPIVSVLLLHTGSGSNRI